ncbi:S8 family serine peptidase [Angustibacter sp. McL0619]|uniref:S8 family serine peptidase n=1 Tax=Angustibacter sp. McL0619 TaxID=3415676 RepID=UPI003CEAF243
MNASQDWQRRRADALARALAREPHQGGVAQVDADEGYLFRPGQLLLGRGAVDELRSETQSSRVRPDEELNARFEGRGVDLQAWQIPSDVRLTALQRTLAPRVEAVGSHVALNHVFAGEWVYFGGPASEPSIATGLTIPASFNLLSDDPDLAVLDTGVTDPAHALFAPALLDEMADDIDRLNEDGDRFLDTEAGHGTFICGLAQRVAPNLALEQRKVLTSNGFGDDLTVALGVAETTAPVINLSLGGYTRDNRRPRALRAALSALDPSRVVVAAAGNNGHSRRFWPAAFREVIAVAAYDSANGRTASFSNYGPWVDVCAPGVDLHSSYVDGVRDGVTDDPQFSGWATWSGTSFAAPLVAAEIARRTATSNRTAREVADEFLEELGDLPEDGYGRRYAPATDVRLPAATTA